MRPPLGPHFQRSAGIVVDFFGGTAWRRAEPGTCAAVCAILDGERPDPAELRRIDWALAPFSCPECEQTYSRADWDTYVLFDEGSYDCTMGTWPAGHRHMLDD
jgi:hypothetical protein